MKKALLIMLLLVFVSACSNEAPQTPEQPTPTITAIPTASATEIPPMSLEVRLDAETKYEQLRQLHTAIGDVWETLLSGESAQCGAPFDVLSPESITGDDPVIGSLRQAAIELESAVRLWEAECQNPRSQPPSDVIDQGVRMVRAAGDALADAEERLAENP